MAHTSAGTRVYVSIYLRNYVISCSRDYLQVGHGPYPLGCYVITGNLQGTANWLLETNNTEDHVDKMGRIY